MRETETRVSRLYAVVDAEVSRRAGWTPPELAKAYLEAGVRLLQVRAPGVATATLCAWCQEIVELARPTGAQVLVNDRCDVALMVGAAGVHLGQEDLPVGPARTLLGTAATIGLSTHDHHQVERALQLPVSYLAVGPVYETTTKDTGYAAVGLGSVTRTARLAGVRPVVAIGGITLETAPQVIAAGAASVAVISDLLVGNSPATRARHYLEALAPPNV
ncbi:MAG: thiamine phosphate synthase [Acidobacteriota bacterium]|nr:thiamine phosphate synthase [Acidobacteriota bacterium]